MILYSTDQTEVLVFAPCGVVPKQMESMNLDRHVNCLVHSCFCQLRNFAKLRPTMSLAEKRMITASVNLLES